MNVHVWLGATMLVLSALVGQVESVHGAAFVESRLETLHGEHGADLQGKFRFQVDRIDPAVSEWSSVLLVLDAQGAVADSIPIDAGTELHIAVRDRIDVHVHGGRQRVVKVFAPGALIRVTARAGFEEEVSYLGPFAVLRVDRPEDGVTSASTSSPRAPLVVTIAAVGIAPETIRIHVDCVDVLASIGGVLPGTGLSGNLDVRGSVVHVAEVSSELEHGRIRMVLLDLPGGTHYVTVTGRPVYESELPPGYPHWNRPIGLLSHKRGFQVFRTEITAPESNAALPLAALEVRGAATHGLPIAGVRVHGAQAQLGPRETQPGDDCIGPTITVPFRLDVPLANIRRDVREGDDLVSSVDPGVAFISAIGTDSLQHAANDRVRVVLGATRGGGPVEALIARARGSRARVAADPACERAPTIAPEPNGISSSASAFALTQLVRAKALPLIRDSIAVQVDRLKGMKLETFLRCPTEPDPPAVRIERAAAPRRGGLDATLDQPPLFPEIGDQEVHATEGLVVYLHAYDPEGRPIAYSILEGPDVRFELSYDTRKLAWAVQFNPDCSQLGTYPVVIEASDGANAVTEDFVITVLDAPPIPWNPGVERIAYDPATMDMRVVLDDDKGAFLIIDTGPMSLYMNGNECYGNCLLCCCCELTAEFTVQIRNIEITQPIDANTLAFGLAEGAELPEATVALADTNLRVDYTDVHSGGCLCWLAKLFSTPIGIPNFYLFIAEEFGAEPFADTFLRGFLKDAVHDHIGKLFKDLFPADEFSGLTDIEFDTELPASSAVGLCTSDPMNPEITGESIVLGFESRFEPRHAGDPVPPWIPSPSRMPAASVVGGDVSLGLSDDAMNQLMASLSSGTTFRRTIRGLTLAQVVPFLTQPIVGVDLTTPIVLTTDLAQIAGSTVPPIVVLEDDLATKDRVEFAVRTQLVLRVILERAGVLTDDRGLCDCATLTPDCLPGPCVLVEVLGKLNFQAELTLAPAVDGGQTLVVRVERIQLLERPSGIDIMEAQDLSSSEQAIVAATTEEELLETLRSRINADLPPLPVPGAAFTLGGWVRPMDFAPFAFAGDRAGAGAQDYIGVTANVALEPTGCGAACSWDDLPTSRAADPPLTNAGPTGPPDVPAAVEADAPKRPELQLSCRAYPNPSVGNVSLSARSEVESPYALRIFAMDGRLVWEGLGALRVGMNTVRWNGIDRVGRSAPSGVYVYRLESGGRRAEGKVLLVRQ